MRNFSFGSGDTQTFTSGNYQGIDIAAYLQQLNVNVAFAGQPMDWSKVQVKVTLSRGGREYDIVNDNALPLILASGYYNTVFDEAKYSGLSPFTRVLQAAGAAAKAIGVVSGKIMFGGMINLQPGEQLRVELNSQVTALNSANTDTTASQIRWALVEGVGNSFSIPYLKAKAITSGLSALDETLGSHVTKIFVINNDQNGILATNRVVESAQIMSDKLTRSINYEQLFMKRAQEIDYSGAATNGGPEGRGQSFNLFNRDYDVLVENHKIDDVRLHNCAVHLNLNSGVVNASVNWLAWYGFYPDTATASKAVERADRLDKKNAAQYAAVR